MKKIFLALSLLSLVACNKDDKTPKAGSNEGYIKFINTSSNPYKIYVGTTAEGVVGGNKSKTITKPIGKYALSAIQESGYVLYPTTKDININLKEGATEDFIFP